MSKTLVVVPTHNEADNIAALLDGLDVYVPDADVVVIDDVSTDATRGLVRSVAMAHPNVRLVEREQRLGLGSAYVHGFGLALAEGYDLVVEIDADLSHNPAALPAMLAVADLGFSVVIGSRYVPGGSVVGWPRHRLWLSRWGNRYAAIMLGLAINDATAGYRVYRTDALSAIGIDGTEAGGYGFQIEMAYRAVRMGLSVVEVPIQFRDRVAGVSQMDKGIVWEAFKLVTYWGLADLVSLRRRRRAYREVAVGPATQSRSS
jgi:dolichol-phosphate mannosyltransferase